MTLLAFLILLSSPTLPELADAAAKAHGLNPAVLRRVVELESDWVITAVGDDGESCGLLQFKAETWTWLCRLAGVPEWGDPENRFDPTKALLVGAWAMANGYGPHWSTWHVHSIRSES